MNIHSVAGNPEQLKKPLQRSCFVSWSSISSGLLTAADETSRRTHMFRIFVCTILFVFASPMASSTEAIGEQFNKFPKSAKDALLDRFPSLLDEVDFAQGDVDADGITDIVAIIHYVSEGTELESIVVLKGSDKGLFALVAESIGIEPHMRRTENVTIKAGTISVSAGFQTYTEYSGTEYKFKVYSGSVLLIGMESSRGTIGDDRPSDKFSANFLTNTTISTSWNGAAKKPTVLTQRLRGNRKIPLGQFALDGTSDAIFLR